MGNTGRGRATLPVPNTPGALLDFQHPGGFVMMVEGSGDAPFSLPRQGLARLCIEVAERAGELCSEHAARSYDRVVLRKNVDVLPRAHLPRAPLAVQACSQSRGLDASSSPWERTAAVIHPTYIFEPGGGTELDLYDSLSFQRFTGNPLEILWGAESAPFRLSLGHEAVSIAEPPCTFICFRVVF
ncbi:unnamed protein product [Ectocarpus sp. 8 AP-2014]